MTSRMGLTRELSWTHPFEAYIKNVEPFVFHAPLRTEPNAEQPLFSIVVPFFNTPDEYLIPLLDSVASQSFADWEMIMADASTDRDRSVRLEELSHGDSRFRYVRLGTNAGIASNTNTGIQQARGRFIVFVDHDDTLSHHALNEAAVVIADHEDVDVIYSDEDAISDDGWYRKRPSFKPSWSPHMFLEMNYTNHLSVIRADLVREVGLLRPDRDGAQDYDLLLRIHALPREITTVHIPKILYHWREAQFSSSRAIGQKSYAMKAGTAAVTDYLDAIGVDHDGVDILPDKPAWYHCHPRWSCRVDVVVMVSDDVRVNSRFEEQLRAATGATWVVPRFRCLPPTADISEQCTASEADAVVVMRAMYLPKDRSWLDELVGALRLPQTAAVAPLLMTGNDNLVANAGFMEHKGQLRPLYHRGDVTFSGLAGLPDLLRDVDGLDDAVVAFPVNTDHPELFLTGVVDGRTWSDRLVLWGLIRLYPAAMPFRDTLLNDNLSPRDALVVLKDTVGI
ncbi:MAG: glycosyltransferase [Propionibacteriaceae bacterium]|nr:glycosyltransferase [Propionibacteriaceae bacterium]